MIKEKRKNTGIIKAVGNAVGRVFSSAVFLKSEYGLSFNMGGQLSFNGLSSAVGNGGGFTDGYSVVQLTSVLNGFPSMRTYSQQYTERLAERHRFTVMYGEADRDSVIFECIREIIKNGVVKLIIATGNVSERYEIFSALSMLRSELMGANVTEFTAETKKEATALVYEYLTSDTVEIMVIGQASFTRQCNLIRQNNNEADGAISDMISGAAPVVLVVSDTVSSVRTIASAAKTFSPAAVVCLTPEVRSLRDAVIFKPSDIKRNNSTVKTNENKPFDDEEAQAQIGF